MRASKNLEAILAQLDDSDIMTLVGPATWGQGLTFFEHGHLSEHSWTYGNDATTPVELEGRVRDTGVSYRARISEKAGTLHTTCACLLGRDCKHCVTLILAGRDEARTRLATHHQPTWKRSLETLLGRGLAQGEPMALLVDAHDPSHPTWLTPMRRGTQVRWTHKRASWADVTQAQWESVTEGLNPRHIALLREGYRRASEGKRWHSAHDVSLEDLGTDAGQWLTDLALAGVTLLADERTPLTLDPSSWDLALDASLDAAGMSLTPVARNGETIIRSPRIAPETGLLVLDGGTRIARVYGSELLTSLDLPLLIPTSDLAEFQTQWLERLRAHVSLISTDGSVTRQLSDAPNIVATVRMEGNRTCIVRWWAEYTYAGGSSRIPVREGLQKEEIRTIAERIDHRGRVLAPAHLWAPALSTLRFPAWQARDFLDEVVGRVNDPALIWDVAPDVQNIRIEDGMTTRIDVDDEGNDWFSIRLTLNVSGRDIPLEDVLRALAAGETHVYVEGAWVAIRGESVDRLRDLMEQAALLSDSPAGQVRISGLHVGLWDEFVETADQVQAARSWYERVMQMREMPQALPVPTSARATLRPYQEEGHRWLTQRALSRWGGILADDMGLGKTLQVLSAIAALREDVRTKQGESEGSSSRGGAESTGGVTPERGNTHVADARTGNIAAGHTPNGNTPARDTPPVLVVAPTSVVATWSDEAQRFFPDMRVSAVTSTGKRRERALEEIAASSDVVVTSYTILRLEDDEWASLAWEGLILDEAQAAKNPKTAVYRVLSSLKRNWTFAVTGTPVENSLADLWALMSLSAPGVFPRWKTFRERIQRPIENEGNHRALERVRQLSAPLILRRTKEDVAPELPDKVDSVLHVELAPSHRRLYDRYLTRERAKILGLMDDFSANRMEVLASITRLRQLALDPALVSPNDAEVGSAKIDVLCEHLEEIVPRGHRVLVFSQFTSYLERIRQAVEARGISVVQLDGSTRKRPEVIRRFHEGEAPVFLISLKAGGTGLTLTEADYVYMMDPWWNPAAEAQAIDRAHRIGQTKKVNVYRLVAADTIEEKVVALQQKKRELMTAVVDGGSGENTSTRGIRVEDLRELLAEKEK